LQASIGQLPCRSPRVVIALARATASDMMGDRPGTEAAYEEARALSRQVPSPPLQARVLLRYGVYLRRRDERVAARKPFAEAHELAESVGAEIIRTRAAEELAAVGGRQRRRHENPDALTGAEARVASLAYEGMSDREIAQRLNISVHTVETHLQHVYRKLGIKSRRDLMRRPPPWNP
jgi:DNA-binding CsgD family transcriptional regulator